MVLLVVVAAARAETGRAGAGAALEDSSLEEGNSGAAAASEGAGEGIGEEGWEASGAAAEVVLEVGEEVGEEEGCLVGEGEGNPGSLHIFQSIHVRG